MSIIRKAQPALTSIFPHPGNRRYMIPNRSVFPGFGTLTVYDFNVDFWTADAAVPWDSTGVFKVSVVFRPDVIPAGGAQIAVAESASDFRSIRIASSDVVKWRDSSINLLSNLVLVAGGIYRATIDGDGAGKHTLTVEQFGGGIDAVSDSIPGDATDQVLHVGSNSGGGNNFAGPIAEYSLSLAGALANEWPMHDGDPSTIFAASVGGVDITQQSGSGAWITV